MKLTTLDKKIQILEYIASSSGAYYSFNLTQDRIPGVVTQYVDGKAYNANKLAKLPRNCRFSEYIAFWGNQLSGQEADDYFAFFKREHLLNRYCCGEQHLQFTYWTTTVTMVPMLAEQHIFLFRDEETEDVLGITYIIDQTEKHKDSEYTRLLEQGNKTLAMDLFAERRFLDVLARDYYTVYHVDLNTDTSVLLKSDPAITATKISNSQLRKPKCYSQRISQYANLYVVDGSRQDFLRQTNRDFLMKALETSQRHSFRYRSLPNEAGYQYFEAQLIRLNSTRWDGHMLLAFRYIDDVIDAEQKHQMEIEEQMAQKRNQLEIISAISSIYYAIFRIDLETDTYEKISCREEVSYLYGNDSSASRELNNLCNSFIDPKDRGRMLEFFHIPSLARRIGKRESIEAECLTLDGNWHRAYFIPKTRDSQGNATQVLYVTKMITEEKQREKALITMAETAADANAAKTEFISQVAHDVRTPMNAMFGFLEIAKANLDDRERVDYCLEKIRSAGEFLKELANDILDISRMESGKMHLQPESVNLKALLQDFCATMDYSKLEKKLTFHHDFSGLLWDQVILDPLRLRQIYSNVLTNALKYTPDGGSVSFTVWQEEGSRPGMVQLLCTVADTGIGMSEAFMERMFEKFERATDTRINKVSGHGLGLSIVKQMVELMGGTIQVRSALGQGTTVRICLEVPCVADSDSSRDDPPVQRRKSCRGLHLLVAEDNKLNEEVLVELLKMEGITCDCAEDGQICLQKFQAAAPGTYDAILMDMQMPNMTGPEAARALRALPSAEAATIPVFAMTANALKDDVQECLKAGMNQHLAKPIDMAALLDALARYTM